MTNTTCSAKRARFVKYLHTCYGYKSEIAHDILQRYDANYNGMQAHWDHVMDVIDERVAISLSETRGQAKVSA